MDKTPLVMDEIEAGKELIKRMDAYQPVKAAWWMRPAEDGERYLHVALDGLTVDNTDAAYREVLRIANEMPDHYIDPFRVKLVSTNDPAARAVLDIYRSYSGRKIPTRVNDSVLGGEVAEVYLYPPPGSKP
jgi:hypothetical protein